MEKNNAAEWALIQECETETTKQNFWKCIWLFITKPSALNRNIGGCDLINLGKYSVEKCEKVSKYLTDLLKGGVGGEHTEFSTIKKLIEDHFSSGALSTNSIYPLLCNLSSSAEKNAMFLRLTYPKNGKFRKDIIDIIFCDFEENSVVFTKIGKLSEKPPLLVNVPYKIEYDKGTISLSVVPTCEEIPNFLKNTLFPKVVSWAKVGVSSDQSYSLSLIQINEYTVLYNELKKKYVNTIKEFWTESTNMEKFIHEDIAIAAYLILLWGSNTQNFVDLGCGNGLLVYILNSEGHQGVGIDLRKRKIWDKYPSITKLQEAAISPSDRSLFPSADWIIGNHSDELTPWIPVIAARSSFKTNFFLLPCCAYEFNGSKYCRSDASRSQYQNFMDYVEEISEKCGFVTFRDRLRIPSTKRICFISQGRTYCESEHNKIDEEIVKMMNHSSETDGKWLTDYKLREPKEAVRNCTQLNKSVVSNIVNLVANVLLNKKSNMLSWNEGTAIELSVLAESLPDWVRVVLANQRGGLQTLLKNHHHIFQVVGGTVKIRKPVEREDIDKTRRKQKICWFFNNHPDSCPLEDDRCSYLHVSEERIT